MSKINGNENSKNTGLFSARLREVMQCANVSQTTLARIMNTSQQCISFWCNGVYQPSIEQILDLCRILETDPNYLLGYSDM